MTRSPLETTEVMIRAEVEHTLGPERVERVRESLRRAVKHSTAHEALETALSETLEDSFERVALCVCDEPQLCEGFQASERGNIWLVDPDSPGDQNAWIRLGEGRWLQISARLENYPGLSVSVITASDEQLARHIREHFSDSGFVVRRMNLQGVEVSSDHIIAGEEELLCVHYECPKCGHAWQERWSCACDSQCPACGAKDIEATDSHGADKPCRG